MLENDNGPKIPDLIDIDLLQRLQDFFADAINVASITVDDEGPITKPSNFTDFCIKYTRGSKLGYKRCNECDIKWGKVAAQRGEPVIYSCHTGLTDFAVPIVVQGKHIASILGGQVLTSEPDEAHFRQVARDLGIDEEAYVKEVMKLKVLTPENVQAAANLLFLVANTISEIGLKNYKLIEKNKREKLYRTIVETTRTSLDIDETEKIIVEMVGKTLGADRCFVVEYDNENNKYLKVDKEYLSRNDIISYIGADVNVEIPNFAEALKRGQALLINNKEIFLNTDNRDFKLENDAIERLNVYSAFSIPLFFQKEYLGVLAVHYVQEHFINEDEINLMTMIGNQISLAIHQAKLYKTTQTQAAREKFYRKITENIRSTLDLDDLFTLLCNELASVFNVQRAFIVKYKTNSHTEVLIKKEFILNKDIRGLSDKEFDYRTVEYWGKTLFDKNSKIIIDNIPESDTPDYFKKTYESIGEKSTMGIAIRKGDDNWGWVGVAEYDYYRHWTEEEILLLETLSDQIYMAITQAELYNKTKKNAEREFILRKVIEIIRSSINIDHVKNKMVNQIGDFFKADRVAFADYDFEKGNYFIYPGNEYRSSDKVKSFVGYDFASAPGFIQSVRDIHISGKDIIFSDLDEYLQDQKLKDPSIENFYRDMDFMSSMAINIYYLDSFYGNLVLSFSKKRQITEDDINIMKNIADQSGIAIYQSSLYEKEKKTAEREKLIGMIMAKAISALDIREIKQITRDIGIATKADRCYFVEVDTARMSGKPVEYDAEYLSSPDVKSIIGYNFPTEDVRRFVEIYLDQRDLIIFDFEEIKAKNDPINQGINRYSSRFGLKSAIGIPFIYMNKVSAILCIEYSKEKVIPSSSEKDFLKILTNQIGMVFNQILLFQETKKTAERESLLRNIIEILRGTLNSDDIKKYFVDIMGNYFDADRCFFLDYDKNANKFLPIIHERLKSSDITSFIGIDPGVTVPEFTERLRSGKNVIAPDLEKLLKNENFATNQSIKVLMEYGVKSDYALLVKYKDTIIGAIVIHFLDKKRALKHSEYIFLKVLRDQAGIAFNQIELYQSAKRTAEREALLRKVITAVRSTLDLNETFKIVGEEIAKVFNVQRVTIMENSNPNNLEESQMRMEYRANSEIKPLPSPEEIKKVGVFWNGDTAMRESAIAINSIPESNIPDFVKDFYKELGVKSFVSVPISSRESRWGGIYLSEYNYYREWSEDDLTLLRSIAEQVYIAINQAELYSQAKEHAERETLLRKIYETMRSSLNIDDIKSTIVEEVGKALDADICLIMLYDSVDDTFSIDKYSEYRSSSDLFSFIDFNTEEDKVKWFIDIFKSSKEFHFSNLQEYIAENHLEGSQEANFLNEYGLKSCYSVAIEYANKRLGYLILQYTRNYRTFSDEDLKFIKTITTQAGIALHQAELYEITQLQAEREKISKNIIEILRSTLDKNMIKHLFVQNIGKYFKADRVFYSEYDAQRRQFLPVDKNSEYLSSPNEKSFVGYDWTNESVSEYIQPLKEKRELIILCWKDYIKNNPKSQSFISLFEDANVRSSYNIPVLYQEKIMGYFCIEFTKDTCVKLSNEDINRIRNISAQAGISLYHSKLYIQAQESAHSKEAFIANISSELKTPLDNIIEISQKLAQSDLDHQSEIEYLNVISDDSQKLLDLRDDIINISQIESEDFRLNYENIDSEQLVMDVLSTIKQSADEKQIVIDADLKPLYISADRDILKKILYNFLSNMMKLTPEKSHLAVKTELDSNKLIISLEDSGIGLDADVQNKLFETFKQMDSIYASHKKGEGLGLSVAKKLIELHNGVVHVDSTEDKGTRILLILPNARGN